MNQRSFFTPLRTAAITLLFTCTVNQSTLALPDALTFEQETSVENYAQLVTAILTLPADMLATTHPDDNRLNLLNHTLKFINESLAIWLQNSPHSATWAGFDAVQCYKALTALRSKTNQEQITAANDDDLGIEDATEAIATATGDNAQQWQKFVHYANYVLASAETVTRVAATLNNNNPTITNLGDSSTHKLFGSLIQQSEFYHGLTSLIRLTRYCLQAPDKKKMAVLMVLILAEILTVSCQYKGIANHKADEDATTQQPIIKAPTLSDNKQATSNKTTIPAELIAVQERRPLDGIGSANRPYNQDNDFTICLTQFAQECQQEHRDLPQSYWFQQSFNEWCRQRDIEPFFDLGMRPLFDPEFNRFQQTFNAFWNNVQQNQDGTRRPPFIRPAATTQQPSTGNVADFCNAFAEFYRAQPAATTPILPASAQHASLFNGTKLR